MWKKLAFLMLASTALFANEHNEYNEGIVHLREARKASNEMGDIALKIQTGKNIDIAINILVEMGFNPHAGQVTNAVFFDLCNFLNSVPDEATYRTMKEITFAEEAFRKSVFTKIEHDMKLMNR